MKDKIKQFKEANPKYNDKKLKSWGIARLTIHTFKLKVDPCRFEKIVKFILKANNSWNK